jgi:hypothetical protein
MMIMANPEVASSNLAAAMLAAAAARVTGSLQVAGDRSSGLVWFVDGDVVSAGLTNDPWHNEPAGDDPICHASFVIERSLDELFSNRVLTLHFRDRPVPDDVPRFDTLHFIRHLADQNCV